MRDIRCRYHYTIRKDEEVIFEGYLLHEEAWRCLNTIKGKTVSCTFRKSDIAKDTSKHFADFYKNIK